MDTQPDLHERVDEMHAAETQMQIMLEKLQHLTDEELDVVALCDWGGLDYWAAATSLDIPIGTVRSRLSRSRRKLAAEETGERHVSTAHNNSERQVTLRRLENS